MLLRSNVLYVGPWWQTLLAPRARPFAQTRLLAIAMRFAKDIRHERTLSFPKYSISAMPPFLQEVDLAVPWMGWSPAEGGKRGRCQCQCKSTPLLCPFLLSITFVSWSFIIWIHFACIHDGGLHFPMISKCVESSSHVYLHTKNVSPMLLVWCKPGWVKNS